ncbi:MAG: accessory factor UbiK family protein [Natronospirillum sp.]|uniref:accessory factor UbiK family protein n=1 Tax=Natronospirillum sp. TaxID=2812955 RepID=UPI0025CC8203|nr:accessory factor UbiK family protein [Natronospirillum sp.]MCH8551968.1 accessory factor UbiK family protein [Natronospirillum sp.]
MAGLDDLSARLAESLARARAQGDLLKSGLEDNLQALIQAQLERLDVVTREDFEAQQALLRQAMARIEALETELERWQQAADGASEDDQA